MNEELYITFENYFSNEMSPEEKLEFENQLLNDLEMQQKFEIYKETNQFLGQKFDPNTANFKENLKAISQEHFAETKKGKTKVITFKPWYYAVAASVVLAFGLWITVSGNPEYSDFAQHENASFMERSSGDENAKDAQNAFNAKDYKKAVAAFDKIRVLNPEQEYFYAIALIETDDYVNAEIFLNHMKSGGTVYKYKATWYLALSNLKQKKFDECKKYLEEIPADAEDYGKAQELLKDLE